jgi:excisionase family DNA binding protein
MSFAPHIVAVSPPVSTVRACASVRDVASMLACHQSQVRRLIAAGEIEGFIIGRRGVRAYLDSVAAYQARQEIHAVSAERRVESARRAVTCAADAAAQARLRAAGDLS